MLRHIMVSTIFEKNRLDRLLKSTLGKSAPSYLGSGTLSVCLLDEHGKAHIFSYLMW